MNRHYPIFNSMIEEPDVLTRGACNKCMSKLDWELDSVNLGFYAYCCDTYYHIRPRTYVTYARPA